MRFAATTVGLHCVGGVCLSVVACLMRGGKALISRVPAVPALLAVVTKTKPSKDTSRCTKFAQERSSLWETRTILPTVATLRDNQLFAVQSWYAANRQDRHEACHTACLCSTSQEPPTYR